MTYLKDPDATLDYEVDWSQWLAVGETIATSVWVVPTGITQGTAVTNPTNTDVWLTGGTAGVTYRVTNRITTTGGRTDDRTIAVQVTQR